MKLALRWVLALVALVAASAAWATFHTYQIDEIFSNADGTVQFIVLREAAGMNGQNFLAGRTLTSTGGSANQTFTFPTNLGVSMDTGYGQMLTPTAFTRVLIATQGFAQLGIVAPDYLIPNGFIPTGKGAHGLYVSRDSRYMYVSNRGEGSISVVDLSSWSNKDGGEGARNIFHVDNRPPWRAVALENDPVGRHGPCHQVI